MAVVTRDAGYRPGNRLERLSPPVEIDGDSIIFNPVSMTTGHYYLAVLHGEPYLYRKISETEVEVYGLAD